MDARTRTIDAITRLFPAERRLFVMGDIADAMDRNCCVVSVVEARITEELRSIMRETPEENEQHRRQTGECKMRRVMRLLGDFADYVERYD